MLSGQKMAVYGAKFSRRAVSRIARNPQIKSAKRLGGRIVRGREEGKMGRGRGEKESDTGRRRAL